MFVQLTLATYLAPFPRFLYGRREREREDNGTVSGGGGMCGWMDGAADARARQHIALPFPPADSHR